MLTITRRRRCASGVLALGLLATTALAACGSDNSTAKADASPTAATTAAVGGSVTTAAGSELNLTADQKRIVPAKVDAIAAEVPQEIRDRGKLVIGVGARRRGLPAAGVRRDDQHDAHRLRAGHRHARGRRCSGLQPDIENTSWENLFIGLDAGTYDVAFSNVTDTEERKQKYDFASYREDNLGVRGAEGRRLDVHEGRGPRRQDDRRGLGHESGEAPARATPTRLKAKGLTPITVKYFQDTNSVYLALSSGRSTPTSARTPSSAYHAATSGDDEGRRAGLRRRRDPAGPHRRHDEEGQRLGPGRSADAINEVIKSGDYAKVARSLEPHQRGGDHVADQPARSAPDELVNGCGCPHWPPASVRTSARDS